MLDAPGATQQPRRVRRRLDQARPDRHHRHEQEGRQDTVDSPVEDHAAGSSPSRAVDDPDAIGRPRRARPRPHHLRGLAGDRRRTRAAAASRTAARASSSPAASTCSTRRRTRSRATEARSCRAGLPGGRAKAPSMRTHTHRKRALGALLAAAVDRRPARRSRHRLGRRLRHRRLQGGESTCTATFSLAGGASNKRLTVELPGTNLKLVAHVVTPHWVSGAYSLSRGGIQPRRLGLHDDAQRGPVDPERREAAARVRGPSSSRSTAAASTPASAT